MVDIWPLGVAEFAHPVIIELYFPSRNRAWRFLIQAVKRTHEELITNIKEYLASADKGRMLSSRADEDTFRMEMKLRNTLAASHDKIHIQRFLSADM